MDNKSWLESTIKSFLDGDINRLGGQYGDERAWDAPLVGYANGADELFVKYKEVVDPAHWMPAEIFKLTFPDSDVPSSSLSVVSWVLPQTAKTKLDERNKGNADATERWTRARYFGEKINDALRRHIEAELCAKGYRAVAPMISPSWKMVASEKFVFASLWSERHAAHACGLGTFGICDGLITPVGKALRLGSVVTDMPLDPSPREYTKHNEYCPFLNGGGCGVCIQRCPAGALSPNGHDKLKCRDLNVKSGVYVKEHFGFDGYGCGSCQTGVPCQDGIPGRRGGGRIENR